MYSEKLPIDQKLIAMEGKIRKLMIDRTAMQNELKNSKLDVEKLQKCLNEQNEDLKNFQNQTKITKIVNVTTDDTKSTVELKILLNQYIREIDKCIANLSE